jgi:hypothetical protein
MSLAPFIVSLPALLVAACSSENPSDPREPEATTALAVVAAAHPGHNGRIRLQRRAEPASNTASNTALVNGPPPNPLPVSYFGGRVISNTQIVQVNWGSGTYQNFVTDGTLASYYSGIVNSPYIDWLSEYDTVVDFVRIRPVNHRRPTGYTIGRGGFGGAFSITPSTTATSLTDAQIQSELTQQIASGALPAPVLDTQGNSNTLYFVHFPQGFSLTTEGLRSCVDFCAYHGAFVQGSQEIDYAVMPDMSAGSGCDRCEAGTTPLQTVTAVASHELGEAITDPDVTLIPPNPPADDAGVPDLYPAGWIDAYREGEIGDLCRGGLFYNAPLGSVTDANGNSWTVQRLWSNAYGECMASHLANGGFELGNLAGWSHSGDGVLWGFDHSGIHSLALGATETVGGSSSVSQTFDLPDPVPAGTITFSYWREHECAAPGTSWATVKLVDNATGATLIPATPFCDATFSPWTQTSLDVTASHGHNVTLTITNWDDPQASQRSYLLIDDVATAPNPPPAGNPIVDPSFEVSSSTAWSGTGSFSVRTSGNAPAPFTGNYSGATGSINPTSGDSTLFQSFTAQAGSSTIRLHVQPICRDTVDHDWVNATLQDNTAGTTTVLLANTCTNDGTWKTVTGSVVPGHNYTVTLLSHDDGAPGTATLALWDDVTVQ